MLAIKFLGTSDAQGVPRLRCDCSVCTDQKAVNKRTRPSILVTIGTQTILVDVSPDFHQQYIQHNNHGLIPDTVLITHAHNDHIAGFGDYADLCFWNQIASTVISPPDVIEKLRGRYPYLAKRESMRFLEQFEWEVSDCTITFHKVNHGFNGYSYGIRFATNKITWAYVSDAFDVTDRQLEPFCKQDLLILGTSFWDECSPRERRSVYSVKEALQLIKVTEPKQLILTHLSHDIDIVHRSLQLPSNVRFAYDGLEIQLI